MGTSSQIEKWPCESAKVRKYANFFDYHFSCHFYNFVITVAIF